MMHAQYASCACIMECIVGPCACIMALLGDVIHQCVMSAAEYYFRKWYDSSVISASLSRNLVLV